MARALCSSLIQSPAQRASRVNGDVHNVLSDVSAVVTHEGTLVSEDRAAISRMTPVVRNRMVGRIETLPEGKGCGISQEGQIVSPVLFILFQLQSESSSTENPGYCLQVVILNSVNAVDKE